MSDFEAKDLAAIADASQGQEVKVLSESGSSPNFTYNASWELTNQEYIAQDGSESIDSNTIIGISPEEETQLVLQSIVDAETYIRYANQYIMLLRSGKKTKGTKLSGQVKNHRNNALASSLTDVRYSTVA